MNLKPRFNPFVFVYLIALVFTAIPSVAPAMHLIAGSETAKVQMLIFGDFQCPPTGLQVKDVAKLSAVYGNRIGIHFSSFPIYTHPEGRPAAIALECAADQDAYLPFFKEIFDHQQDLGEKFYLATAHAIAIHDEVAFASCLKSAAPAKRVDEEFARGVAMGVYGTPISFINGQRVLGPDYDETVRKIEDTLTKDPWKPH